MNSLVGHQVCLELNDVDLECAIETDGGDQRGNDFTDQFVEIGVGLSFHVELSSADVIKGFVVEHNCHIGVL